MGWRLYTGPRGRENSPATSWWDRMVQIVGQIDSEVILIILIIDSLLILKLFLGESLGMMVMETLHIPLILPVVQGVSSLKDLLIVPSALTPSSPAIIPSALTEMTGIFVCWTRI